MQIKPSLQSQQTWSQHFLLLLCTHEWVGNQLVTENRGTHTVKKEFIIHSILGTMYQCWQQKILHTNKRGLFHGHEILLRWCFPRGSFTKRSGPFQYQRNQESPQIFFFYTLHVFLLMFIYNKDNNEMAIVFLNVFWSSTNIYHQSASGGMSHQKSKIPRYSNSSQNHSGRSMLSETHNQNGRCKDTKVSQIGQRLHILVWEVQVSNRT